MKTIRVLGIIPARAGSKGIRGKNVVLLNGKPLLAYTIAAARRSKLLTDCIVSTDSKAIAATSRKYKGKVPFLRPKTLARDKTPTWPVLQHAVREYEKLTGQCFDYVMLLQPTTPLREGKDIDEAIRMMMKHPRKNSLISCYDGCCVHPRIMYKKEKGKVMPFVKDDKEMVRRQTFEDVYVRNGAIYMTKKKYLMNNDRVIGEDPLIMEMPRWRSINIDGQEDLEIARMLLTHAKN